MKIAIAFVIFVIVCIGVFIGVYIGLAAIAAWLYGSLAPQDWVRPTLWQWVAIVFLASLLFGRAR